MALVQVQGGPGYSASAVDTVTAGSAFPGIACRMVRFQAASSNTASVYVKAPGTTGSGWELPAGADTGWVPFVGALSYFTSGGTGSLTYWTMG